MVREVLKAQDILAQKYDVAADVWSATSFQQLRNDALDCERWNRLHPAEPARVPYVTQLLANSPGPVVAATDYMKSVPDMVGRWVKNSFTPLGTDGFGRSDTRDSLRRHFEVDAASIVVAVLSALCREGKIAGGVVEQAMRDLNVNREAAEPREA